MTRSYTNQSHNVGRGWVGTAYDGSAEDLKVDLVSKFSSRCGRVPWLTKTIFSHSTHDVKKAFPIVTSLLIKGRVCWNFVFFAAKN